MPATAHVSSAGATTSTPAVSPSVQVRKTRAELVGRDHAAEAQRRRPEGGADDRRDERAGDEGEHVGHAIELSAPAGQPAQQQGGDDDRHRVSDGLGEHRAEWRREVAEKEVADHDARHQPRAVEEEDGETQAGRRPQRRDRAVEIRELQPELSREVVGERDEPDRDHVNAAFPSGVRRNAATPEEAEARLWPRR